MPRKHNITNRRRKALERLRVEVSHGTRIGKQSGKKVPCTDAQMNKKYRDILILEKRV